MAHKLTTQERVDRLLRSAENVRNATNARQRDAALTFMIRRAQELEGYKHALEYRLDEGWDVLSQWKDEGKPEDYERHHARYLGWLKEYELVCTSLHTAALTWTRPAPAAAPGRESAA